MRLIRALAVLLSLATADAASAAPQTAHDIVCDLTGAAAGHVDGRTYRSDPLAPDDRLRLTFRGHDAQAGTATMLINDDAPELLVGLTVDRHAVAYLYEERDTGKLLVSTQSAPTTEGWPAIVSRHAWKDGALTIKVLAGACRLRVR